MAEIYCPHNTEVLCNKQKCASCGWNPEVEMKRKKMLMREKTLYRVPFTGYCEVWANSPEEAADAAEDIKKQFFANYEYGEPVCLEKEEKNELD
jgi:asparagine synthetase B (glutamine-hydrolysing)